ncbi:MAG: glycosyltransferase family 4 protein [Deltaproteobacteria bacterium]|nr:glycosyltransferase family 4 protein [Deltaproteobacteria bacterium]
MIKVLFVTRKWPPAIGGMETYSYELSKKLGSICDLTIRSLPGKNNGKPPSLTSLAFFLLSAGFFVIKSRSFNVVHIGDLVLWPLALVATVAMPTAKVVVTAYGLDILYGSRKGLLPGLYRFYLALGVRLISQKIKIIAISKATAQLCYRIGFPNIRVVPLGVQEPIKPSGLNQDRDKFLLFVGRLVKRKGAGWFAENVLPLLPSSIRMVVVGKRWDESEWQIIAGNPFVKYLGVVSRKELIRLRCSAVAVLMPNIPTDGEDMEGFGLTALEAGADGGVLLASGIEGIADAVVDGETGFLLPAKDPKAWAEKIREIGDWPSEKRERFVLGAQKIIREKFSWERVARDTLGIYEAHN